MHPGTYPTSLYQVTTKKSSCGEFVPKTVNEVARFVVCSVSKGVVLVVLVVAFLMLAKVVAKLLLRPQRRKAPRGPPKPPPAPPKAPPEPTRGLPTRGLVTTEMFYAFDLFSMSCVFCLITP